MKVLGIIPARFASTRFPGKPLLDLKGKTMIQRVYEGALQSDKIDKLIVATDDERILEVVFGFGGYAELTSIKHSNGTQRCVEVSERNSDYDVVINIQGDEPLVNFRQLNELLVAFEDTSVEIATLGIKTSNLDDLENPNRIKLISDIQGNALYFSRNKIPFERNQLLDYSFMRHIGLYAFKRETLLEISLMKECAIEVIESLEQLRWMYYGKKIKVIETQIETPNIDTPEDIQEVLKYL